MRLFQNSVHNCIRPALATWILITKSAPKDIIKQSEKRVFDK
jgi:hypothetical protein